MAKALPSTNPSILSLMETRAKYFFLIVEYPGFDALSDDDVLVKCPENLLIPEHIHGDVPTPAPQPGEPGPPGPQGPQVSITLYTLPPAPDPQPRTHTRGGADPNPSTRGTRTTRTSVLHCTVHTSTPTPTPPT